jgi:hypothetical protein
MGVLCSSSLCSRYTSVSPVPASGSTSLACSSGGLSQPRNQDGTGVLAENKHPFEKRLWIRDNNCLSLIQQETLNLLVTSKCVTYALEPVMAE